MSAPAGSEVFDVELAGCRPEPLASYLKALGILRIVAEQKDPNARACWVGEAFVLRSSLDRGALTRFLQEEWRPTPVVAPWNGGSGFYPKDNRESATAIVTSEDPRLRVFADAINVARLFVASKNWSERPADEDKTLMLAAMRATLPDEALAWLDAAVVLGDDRLLFPPLLGTGGNDGRLDFSNNFQQRVVEVCAGDATGLVPSLFGDVATMDFKGAMGQYQPAAHAKTNPWDFVLLIEGALMFAATASRRHENSPSTLAFPFHARAAGGHSSVTDSDEGESRDELWLPLWSTPTTLRELRRLFAEGRATVGSGDRARPAASALDFARAVTALGVDRGIDGFVRVGFHVRNGLAYFATPLGRFATQEIGGARLLDDVDKWFQSFRQRASGKNVPARVATARRRLEQALFDGAATGALGPVLLELGEAERALGQSLGFASKAFLRPVPRLQAVWAEKVMGGSPEQRLASALASRPDMRSRLIPLDGSGSGFGRADEPSFVFSGGPFVSGLIATLLREDIETSQGRRTLPSEPLVERCSLSDIASFLEGATDDALIEAWLRALVLIEPHPPGQVPRETVLPSATFAILALVCNRRVGRDEVVPRTPSLLVRASAGDSIGATEVAIRRLRATGHPFPVPALVESNARTRRCAAALAFPLARKQRRRLEAMVLRPREELLVDSPVQSTPEEQS